MKKWLLGLLLLGPFYLQAQWLETIVAPRVHSVQLYPVGNQIGFPVIRLNSGDQLELHFDDLDDRVKNYSYTFQLCNADWTPSMLSQFDFIKGYSQMRLSNYRISSQAFTRYVHYSTTLPDRSCMPARSGNYILKVFQDGDTAKLVLAKRMLVLDEKSTIAAQILQPFNGSIFRTHQKVQLKVNLSDQLSVVNPNQQFKVVILQNKRWDASAKSLKPSFYTRNQFEFNAESDAVFPAGKEWRWLDLRSFRLQSDRVASVNYNARPMEVFVKPDLERGPQRYAFYHDMNGSYSIETIETINPWWQGDYGNVHFAFVPQTNAPIPNKNVYILMQCQQPGTNPILMQFNESIRAYEANVMLKQGYYNYAYVAIDQQAGAAGTPSFDQTEGNYWETENDYQILVYYRGLSGRSDELVGFAQLNSISARGGIR